MNPTPATPIALATLSDVQALAPLFDAYRVFYQHPSDLPLAHKFLRDRLAAQQSVILLARAENDGEAMGFTQLYPSFSSTSAAPIWILNDLYVDPKFRRMGVGKALILEAHQHARRTGAIKVNLSTAHTNLSAQALYESLGYVRDDVFRTYSFAIP